jgi:Ca-activated chloride channel family protein
MRRMVKAVLAAGLFMAGLAWGAPAVRAESDAGRVMLVLDASGSMWGQIDGKSKIEIARGVVADMLSHWDAKTEIGLIAYGHRRKGDCGDIQTLIPPGPLNKAAFLAQVNALTPMGKTPLSQAVIDAAEALKYSEEKATVILVSDGEETCALDPCAVGTELKAKGVDFTAHVIGFDVADPAHQAQLRCLAENTGGTFLTAKNAGELTQALETVTRTVQAAPPPAPPKAAPAPAPEPAAPTGPNLAFSAVYAAGGDPVDASVGWTLFKDAGGGSPGEQVDYSFGPKWAITEPKGAYVVVAELGEAKVQQAVVVTGQPQAVVIDLNAGVLAAQLTLSDEDTALESGVSWKLYRPGEDKELTYSYDAKVQFTVPAGDYRLVGAAGEAMGEQTATVGAGRRTEITLTIGAGTLAPHAVYAAGADPVDRGASWKVLAAEADIQGNRKEISYSFDAKPVFTVPAGQYLLTLEVGETEVSVPVQIAAGATVQPEVVLGAGVLALKATAGGAAVDSGLSWKIVAAQPDIQGNRKELGYSYDAAAGFTLPAGDYLVQVEIGDRKAEQPVKIAAGKRSEVTIALP